MRTLNKSRKLKIVIITEDDPLYVIKFFEVFFSEYPRENIQICSITVLHSFGESLLNTARRMLRFYRPVGFCKLLWRFTLAKLRRNSIANLADRFGISQLSCVSVNDPSYIDSVRALEPDVIVSVCAPELFGTELLKSARLRCVNIHSGRLPRYRGMMPTFWQLLNGEPYVVVTVHEMVERTDAGDVLGTSKFRVGSCDSLDRVIIGTKRMGARLMIRVLLEVAAGADRPQPLDLSKADYFSFPTPADVSRFSARGHRLI